MVQKIGAQYLAKKIADQMLNPTPAAQPASAEQSQATQSISTTSSSPRSQGSDMLLVNDENGRTIGAAYRVPDVAVYVVTNPQFDRAAELELGLSDSDTQVYFHHENGRLAGIIYAPSKTRSLGDLQGGRADDV